MSRPARLHHCHPSWGNRCGRLILPFATLISPLLWVTTGLPALAAGEGPQNQSRRNIDARVDLVQAQAVAPQPDQQQALKALGASVPQLAVTYDPRTGATRSISNRAGYLTEAKPAIAAITIARQFLSGHFTDLGLTAQDIANFEVTDEVYSTATNATHIYLRQVHQGLPVYNGQLQINVNRDGRIISVNNAFMPDIAVAANANVPKLSASDAVRAVADLVGAKLTRPPEVIFANLAPAGITTLRCAEMSHKKIEARLMWLPIQSGEARLVWNFQMATLDGQNVFDFTVDADTGNVWTRFDWIEQESYRVYPAPLENPDLSTTPPPADGREVVVDPFDPLASPLGWHDTDGSAGAEFTIHRGNNVHAYDDMDDVDGGICVSTPSPPSVEPDCGPTLDCDFDFPIDLGTADPWDYTSAAVTNLFYWNNVIHDTMYLYGFDEASGNFQQNNYGRGGTSGDYVLAEAQDGSGNNNANFCTPPDGERPRMQMFLWNRTTPRRDGDFDNGIIIHEYGHGVSNRLVGGPSNVSCLDNAQQPGEGLSDWLLLALTVLPGDVGADPRGIGTYVRGEPRDGTGVRNRRYSTDPLINDYTYESMNGSISVHDVGEVWAQAAWEVYWALVDQHGFDPDLTNLAGGAGNVRALLYFVEGLKNTICSPDFTNARDGMIQAAADNFGGEDVCLLWETFATFGLGEDAVSGGPDSLVVVNGFEVPQICPGLPIVHVTRSGVTALENPLTPSEFTIFRTRDSVTPVTVFYTVSGTATPDVDYVALSGSVQLGQNVASVTIPVDPIDDLEVEPDETVIVTIDPDPNYNIGNPVAAVTIHSDEVVPTISVEATTDTATEVPISGGQFTITRTGNIMPAMDVPYTISGTATPDSDYVFIPDGVISFADDQLTATINVDPLDDPEIERAETVVLTLLPDPSPTPEYELGFFSSATVQIISNESPPVISAATTVLFAFEAGEIPCEFTVTRSGDVSRAGPVFYEITGSRGPGIDFYPPSGVVDFAAGQTSTTVEVTPIDDNDIERDAMIFLDITDHPDYDAPTFNPNAIIKSDEIIPEIRITASDPFANEIGLSTGAFTLTRTLNTGSESFIDLTVSGSATPGSDYVALPSTVTMGIGISTLDIFVEPLPDSEVEPDETVRVTLPFRTLYTIVPPDNATVTILSSDQSCGGDAECDDGLFCNGSEVCSGGICQAGTPVDCDDGIACSIDFCDESLDACDNVPDDAACDNGQLCDGAEVCVAGVGCQSGTSPCDDEIDCTDDLCDDVTGCSNIANDANCDDGLFCNGSETCDAVFDCQGGADPCPGLFCNESIDTCEIPPPQTVYDFNNNAGGDRFAFGTFTDSWTSDLENIRRQCPEVCTEVIDVQADAYARLAASDATGGDADSNRYINPDEGRNDESTLIVEFNIAEDPVGVSQIDVLWEGYGDNAHPMRLYVWSYAQGNWGDGAGNIGQINFMDGSSGNSDFILSGSITTNVSDYISTGGEVSLLIYDESDSEDTFHDYVSITVYAPSAGCQSDSDADGVCDGSDLCPNTIPGSPVTGDGCTDPPIPADFDNDGDVDDADLSLFETCASGPDIPMAGECEDMDLDNDGDGDEIEFSVIQRCFSDEDTPGNPNCAN